MTISRTPTRPTAVCVAQRSAADWISPGDRGLKKCPKTGCVGAPTILGSGGNALAIDDTSVYWASGSKVMRLTPK